MLQNNYVNPEGRVFELEDPYADKYVERL